MFATPIYSDSIQFNEVLALTQFSFGEKYTYIVDSDQLLVGFEGKIWVRPPVKK